MSYHPIAVIPEPEKVNVNPRFPGKVSLSEHTAILADSRLEKVALFLQSALRPATGWSFPIRSGCEKAPPVGSRHIHLVLDEELATLKDEGYRLSVSWTEIRISAPADTGLFYGIQTLLQLLPPAVYGPGPRLDVTWALPCVEIEDRPRFAWRGAMLDSVRYFYPVAFIRKFIDALALHKLNVLHWHLTDDQGWRVEIRKYPRLTEVASRRPESQPGHVSPETKGDGTPHQGYYTQEEIRELVAYAAERNITIVPEIEMPGHAQAALAAYPEYGCTEEAPQVSTAWGVHHYLYHPGDETYAFLTDILDEIMELFPSPFIHIGGDEAVKTQWNECAEIQALREGLCLKDSHELQSYFIGRIGKYLSSHGRRLIGWDEIIEGGLPEDASVMSWRGTSGAVAAAKAGHDVVMAPTQYTYLDFYQSAEVEDEPIALGYYLPLEKVYSFDPALPGVLGEEEARHVLGVQGQLWAEFLPSTSLLEYMAFPRLSALAEIAWTPAGQCHFADFVHRLKKHLRRLDVLDIRYRPID